MSQQATARPAHIAADGGISTSQLRNLVVNDNRDSADSLTIMLRMLGADTNTAYDGERAAHLAAHLVKPVYAAHLMTVLAGLRLARGQG